MRRLKRLALNLTTAALLVLAITYVQAQSTSSITGTITDPTGRLVVNAHLNLISLDTGIEWRTITDKQGLYRFPTLSPGHYTLKTEAQGFAAVQEEGIQLELNQVAHFDFKLALAGSKTEVVVNAEDSGLQLDNSSAESDIQPEVESRLPVLVSGAPRNAIQFIGALPGVSSYSGTNLGVGGANPLFTTRIAGGLAGGESAVSDGVSLQESMTNNTGTTSFTDWPMSPDVVSEVKVIESNYDPKYGSSGSGVIEVVTKSGTKEVHGSAYEYLRNTVLNAKQFGIPHRPPDIEHNFGASVGGPAKVPVLWTRSFKSYGFFDFEGFRASGGLTTPVLTIPTMRERTGDFTETINPYTGAPVPIYDPKTDTPAPDGSITRQQFMGCDGTQPAVICSTRFQSSLSQAWMKLLPSPTYNTLFYNYVVPKPVPDAILAGQNSFTAKGDFYFKDKDHGAVTIYRQWSPVKSASELPAPLSYDVIFGSPEDSWVNRAVWDHTFSERLMNHFAYGYTNRNEGVQALNAKYANSFPKIANTPDPSLAPPEMYVAGCCFFGNYFGRSVGDRPANIVNDIVTLVRGKHTFELGGEYRHFAVNQTQHLEPAGVYFFFPNQTATSFVYSGNSIASFLLDAVGQSEATFTDTPSFHARQSVYALFLGDTWKVTKDLTLNLGVRWDYWAPGTEVSNANSWTDLAAPNPGADGRPGILAFANKASASYGSYGGGQYPERPWRKGFGPRFGAIYQLNARSAIRGGFGVFMDQLIYADYCMGCNLTGHNLTVDYYPQGFGFLDPAFYLSDGFPTNHPMPPSYSPSQLNGLNAAPLRAKDGDRLPYSEQWNLSIQQLVGRSAMFSIGYVGNRGVHLLSSVSPYNYVPISDLSMGAKLFDVFAPGDTSKDGVQAPYQSWASQMAGCQPTVAQALMPYPQYCNPIGSITETHGWSSYNSLQVQFQKRYSAGVFLNANYTWSKLMGTSNNIYDAVIGTALYGTGVYSPDQQWRYHQLNSGDIPHIFNLSAIYTLPFGKGQKWLNSNKVFDAVVGGWDLSGIFHAASGQLLTFTGTCNVPKQFYSGGCFPERVAGQEVWRLSKSQVDQNAIRYGSGMPSVFNINAWHDHTTVDPTTGAVSHFNYQFSYPLASQFQGPRGFGYSGTDISLHKSIGLGPERAKFLIGADAFNVLNQHSFGTAFNTQLDSPQFGQWLAGAYVTVPRNVQIVGRIEF